MTEISIKALISLAPVIVFLLVLLQLDCHRLVGHHRIGQVFAAGSVLPLLAYFVNGYFIDALQLDFTTYSRQVTPHLQLSKHEFWIIHMFEDELPEMT